MIKKYFFNINTVFCVFAASVILFLRLYKIPEFFSFNFDEEYQASLAFEQLKNFHVIWIGVSASNLDYYLGPGFTYLNAFLFWLSRGDPIILGYFSALLGILVTFTIYLVGKDIFSKKVGQIAAVLYGGSALMNFFDRRFWNPTPIPLISLLIFYSLVKAKADTRWYILTAALIGASFHVHLSLLLLAPIVLFIILQNFKKIKKRTYGAMFGIYLLITSPLLVFDFVHNFSNIRAPLEYFFYGKGEHTSITLETIISHARVFLDSLGRFWFLRFSTNIQNEQCLGTYCSITSGNIFFILISISAITYFIFQIRRKYSYKILAATSFIFPLTFIFYPGYAAEYYLLGFFVLLPFIFGIFLKRINAYIVYVVLFFFIGLNAVTVIASDQWKYGLLTRRALIKKIARRLNGTPYSLETIGKSKRKYHPYGGWRYLFKTYAYTPSSSFADEFFGWIYSDELSTRPSAYRIVISDGVKYKSRQKPIAVFKKGVFYGYVFKNKTQ